MDKSSSHGNPPNKQQHLIIFRWLPTILTPKEDLFFFTRQTNGMYFTLSLFVVAIALFAVGILAHSDDTDFMMSSQDVSPLLSPRLDLCAGCCSKCGGYYCCPATACRDACPQCCH